MLCFRYNAVDDRNYSIDCEADTVCWKQEVASLYKGRSQNLGIIVSGGTSNTANASKKE